ncbi:hypothetical protein [Pontibacter rugosus]|uniref:GOLD domain-containing protein n=1 Tax=Pontibacter rugosus TaxID=1745966 RepID=A0ABW3SU27_9BACT
MIRLLAIFALFLFCGFSCSKDEEDVSPLEKDPAPVTMVEMPETAVVGQTVTANIYFVVNNSCGNFGSFDVSTDQMTYTIKVFPKYVGETCAMYLPTRQVNYSFKPEKPGIYILKFQAAGENQYITKTLVVIKAGS